MDIEVLSNREILDLPIDRLALAVLARMAATNEWNLHNFMVSEVFRSRDGDVKKAMIEAMNWLLANGLIARGHPDQSHAESMIITRLGLQVLESGSARLAAPIVIGHDGAALFSWRVHSFACVHGVEQCGTAGTPASKKSVAGGERCRRQ